MAGPAHVVEYASDQVAAHFLGIAHRDLHLGPGGPPRIGYDQDHLYGVRDRANVRAGQDGGSLDDDDIRVPARIAEHGPPCGPLQQRTGVGGDCAGRE